MYLISNIPPIECLVRKEFLYNLKKGYGEFEECTPFAIRSVPGMALCFSVLLRNGAVYDKLPISAFVKRVDATVFDHHIVQLWDCPSYNVAVARFQYLVNKKAKVFLKNKQSYLGNYLFTIDWCADSQTQLDVGFSETTKEHKCAHLIELDCGSFALQPNNRILWHDPGFTLSDQRPDMSLNQQVYRSENAPKWVTEDSDAFFYEAK